MITSLQDAAELSLLATESKEYDASFTVVIDEVDHYCHTVSIAKRDILCYLEDGVANYLVDTYGDRMAIELFELELDKDNN